MCWLKGVRDVVSYGARRAGDHVLPVFVAASLIGLTAQSAQADSPPIETVLAYKPSQPDVEYDIVEKAQYAQCKVNVFREGKTSGYLVTGPQGLVIRRFVDSDGDNAVDLYSYFRNGIEVYRDIDPDGNRKPNQVRWLNTGGLRWGIDQNEDGRIDSWKMISAEEVTRVAVRALLTQDATLLAPLLVTQPDLAGLGIEKAMQTKILESVSDPAGKLKKAATGSKMIGPKTQWMRFDGSAPSVIPADQLGTPKDVFVYENVMAIVDVEGQPGLIQVGELVRVGDVWKMTSLPAPLEGNQVTISQAGLLMEPALVAGSAAGAVADAGPTVSPEIQKMVDRLRELDEKAPSPNSGKADVARYTKSRLELLSAIRAKSDDEEQWTRQMIDSITAAVQLSAYPEGIGQLKSIQQEIAKKNAKSPLISYIDYRIMVGEYGERMQEAPNDERQKIQDEWLKQLEKWVLANPQSEDAANASQQIAIALEFAGKTEKAKDWYEKIVTDQPKSAEAERARGALTRLSLVGKPLPLAGNSLKGPPIDIKQYRNRIVLVVYWSSWCKPCTEDLPELKELYSKYNDRKFEILGVNLDTDAQAAAAYVAQHKLPWQHVAEPGGLEGPLAKQLGIISLPTMFIVNAEGVVYKNSSNIADLKASLTEAYEGKKPEADDKKAAAK